MKNRISLMAMAAVALLSACNPLGTDEFIPEELMPKVKTDAEPLVYFTEAEVGGKIVNFSSAKSVGVFFGTDKYNLDSYADVIIKEDGEYSVKLKGLKPGTKYYYQAAAKLKKESVTGDVVEFITFPEGPVDLGLPSGLKWAAVNLDAEFPTENGFYYAWGEVSNKQQYDWTSYLYCKGTYSTITKYRHTYDVDDGKRTLEPSDDAAQKKLGGKWRMPTAGDFAELVENCTITSIKINGVKGVKLYNKKINDETQFIFFPFAGYKDGVRVELSGTSGYYWTSSLYDEYGWDYDSHNMRFNSISPFIQSGAYRSYGMTIRPVCDK